MTIITRVAVEADISSILTLQADNLYTNLPVAERSGGFVTTPFSASQIQQLLAQTGVFVVITSSDVVGYALVGSWEFFAQWPIFPYMVSRFPKLTVQGHAITSANSFQYGPVCIDRSWRGSNALPQLFATMRSSYAPRRAIGVTFINQANERSLAAHTRKLNLKIIDEFEFNHHFYYTLAFLTAG